MLEDSEDKARSQQVGIWKENLPDILNAEKNYPVEEYYEEEED